MQLIYQLRSCAETRSIPILAMTTSSQLFDSLRPQLDREGCAMLLQPFDIEVLLGWVVTLPGRAGPAS